MPYAQLLKNLWAENRGKILLLVFLSGVFVAIQLWRSFWIEPKIAEARQELRTLQVDLRKARQQESIGGGALIADRSDDVENFYKMVPPVEGLGSFIGRLYSYADSAGIDIEKVSYDTEELDTLSLQQYSLSFDVSGSYTQIKKFVHLLENSPSLLVLDKISLAGARKKDREVVTLQMQMQTYFKEAGV